MEAFGLYKTNWRMCKYAVCLCSTLLLVSNEFFYDQGVIERSNLSGAPEPSLTMLGVKSLAEEQEDPEATALMQDNEAQQQPALGKLLPLIVMFLILFLPIF